MICLIGGTHDSRRLCGWLDQKGLDYFMTVATTLGEQTYRDAAKRLVTGRLDKPAMEALFEKEEVKWVIDASHPYAAEVSQTAMDACAARGLPYTRWLRQPVAYDGGQALEADSFEAAFEGLKDMPGRVLVTGSKALASAVRILGKDRIIARVVPNTESLALCEALNLDAGQVIGLKGPFSKAMNALIYQEWGAAFVVFKASGEGSGFTEKLDAALEMGLTPVVVRAPQLAYPDWADQIEMLEIRQAVILGTETL